MTVPTSVPRAQATCSARRGRMAEDAPLLSRVSAKCERARWMCRPGRGRCQERQPFQPSGAAGELGGPWGLEASAPRWTLARAGHGRRAGVLVGIARLEAREMEQARGRLNRAEGGQSAKESLPGSSLRGNETHVKRGPQTPMVLNGRGRLALASKSIRVQAQGIFGTFLLGLM